MEKMGAETAFRSIVFQAEDGIRDIGVTGVQTCALPISSPGCPEKCFAAVSAACPTVEKWMNPSATSTGAPAKTPARSASQIGRAPCRERVEISVVAASLKKKTDLHCVLSALTA